MQRHDSSVYLKNYMPSYVGKGLQAIVRGLPPQEELMRAASGMSRSIDQRRPRSLDPSQLAQVRQHPELKLLRRRNENLKKNMRPCGATLRADSTETYQSYLGICRQLQSKGKKVKRAMMADIRATYRDEQPVADIENQLRGQSEQEKEQGEPEASHRKLCTKCDSAFHALFTFATSDPAEESKRPSEAIDAVTALCRSQDPSERKVSRSKQTHAIAGSVDGRDEVAKNKPEPISIPHRMLTHTVHFLPVKRQRNSRKAHACLRRTRRPEEALPTQALATHPGRRADRLSPPGMQREAVGQAASAELRCDGSQDLDIEGRLG